MLQITPTPQALKSTMLLQRGEQQCFLLLQLTMWDIIRICLPLISFQALEKTKINSLLPLQSFLRWKSTVPSDTVSWYFVAFQTGHTWESPADSFSFMCAHLLSPSVVGVNPIRESRAGRWQQTWLVGQPKWHLQFGGEGYRVCRSSRAMGGKLIFPAQIWKGNICWSGLEREGGCADMDQEGEDVSDILMYVGR